MKSYIQGIITGGVLVFATIVFMGNSKQTPNPNRVPEFQLVSFGGGDAQRMLRFNPYTGEIWSLVTSRNFPKEFGYYKLPERKDAKVEASLRKKK